MSHNPTQITDHGKENVLRRNALLCIVTIGFLIRFAAVFYGLPQQLDPDEEIAVTAAHKMLSGTPFLDPQWYGWPASTLITLLAAVYSAIAFGGLLFGTFESLADFGNLFYADPSILFLSGRIITVITGTLCIVVTYSLGQRFMSSAYALAAAAIVAFSPWMVSLSSVIRMDMLQILFMLLVIIASINAIDNPKSYKRHFAVAGLFLGLAVTSKYPGVIAILAIFYAAFIIPNLNTGERLAGLLVAGLASLIAAFASGPYLFLNFSAMWQDVVGEARNYHLSATSPGFIPGAWEYATIALPSLTHYSVVIIGYVGLILLSYRRKKEAVIPLLFVGYLFFISMLDLWWKRWALPLIPLVAISFGFALQQLHSSILRRSPNNKWIGIAAFFLVALSVVMQLMVTVPSVQAKLLNNDTRVSALAWVEANIPQGTKILIETYSPQLSSDDYEVFIALKDEIIEWKEYSEYTRPPGYFGDIGRRLKHLNESQLDKALAESGIQYVILSNFYDRFKKEGAEHGGPPLAVYERIFDTSREVQYFDRKEHALGPTIRVRRLD